MDMYSLRQNHYSMSEVTCCFSVVRSGFLKANSRRVECDRMQTEGQSVHIKVLWMLTAPQSICLKSVSMEGKKMRFRLNSKHNLSLYLR